MLIDHIGFFFSNTKYYIIMRIIGRLAAPIFFFCFVEGYLHTHNKNIYRNRLFISAVFMSIINIIMIIFFKYIQCSLPNAINPFEPNMFFTFFVMYQILTALTEKKYTLLFFGIFVPFMEYSFFAFFSILIFYYIKNKNKKFLLFVFFNLILCLLCKNIIELFMIISVLFLYFYNGEKGYYHKYFFYFFYPIHFYFLAFLRIFLK